MVKTDGNFNLMWSLAPHGRQDTIRRMLQAIWSQKIDSSQVRFERSIDCIGTNIRTFNVFYKPDLYLNPKHYSCLFDNDEKYHVIFRIGLDISDTEYGMSSQWSTVQAFVLIIHKAEIVYHKQLFYNIRSRRSDFPKGSVDRKEFPYFPQKKIQRMVDAVANEVLRKIE